MLCATKGSLRSDDTDMLMPGFSPPPWSPGIFVFRRETLQALLKTLPYVALPGGLFHG